MKLSKASRPLKGLDLPAPKSLKLAIEQMEAAEADHIDLLDHTEEYRARVGELQEKQTRLRERSTSHMVLGQVDEGQQLDEELIRVNQEIERYTSALDQMGVPDVRDRPSEDKRRAKVRARQEFEVFWQSMGHRYRRRCVPLNYCS